MVPGASGVCHGARADQMCDCAKGLFACAWVQAHVHRVCSYA